MVSKISDASGEAWVSAFNEEAEKIVGCSADELDKLKSEVMYCFAAEFDVYVHAYKMENIVSLALMVLPFSGRRNYAYQQKLKETTWVPHLFRVSVTQNEYNNEKRQRITVRAVAPIDFAEESRFLLEEIKKMRNSQ